MKRTSKPKQEFVIDKSGFRKELDSYFPKYMLTMKKQISPFIVVRETGIQKLEFTRDLFSLPPSATIFHAWPGKFRTDVFVFTVKELLDWWDKQPQEYQDNCTRVCDLWL